MADIADDLRAALDEAYKRVGEADAQRMVALRKNDERVEELEEALARVAGLEAREARLRRALEQIAAHPHGGILVNIAKHALAERNAA